MKRKSIGMVMGMMLLAAGCASGTNSQESSAEATEAAIEETQEAESIEPEEEEQGKKEEEESLEAAKESLQAAEESLKAMEESLQEVGESLKAEEESAEADKDTSYGKLTEDPEAYLKKQVRFSGKIIRSAALGSSSVQIVLAVNGNETQRVVGEYKKSIVEGTLSTGDTITLSGEFQGMIRYRMQTGGAETMPTVNIGKIENITRKEPETTAAFQPPTAVTFPTTQEQPTVTPETAPVAAPQTQPETTAIAEDNIAEEEPTGATSPVISAGH